MKESLFMGKVTASMTHEIKNVLAIIRESAGLAQDLLEMAKGTDFPHKEKFLATMAKIDKQVERGADIVSRLNAFAHTPDRETCQEDLNVTVDQMVHLSQKLSRSNGINLIWTKSDGSIILGGNPLTSRKSIYQVIEFLAPLAGKGAEIQLKPIRNSKDRAAIQIFIKSCDNSEYNVEKVLESPGWAVLENELESENASIEMSACRDSLLINFG